MRKASRMAVTATAIGIATLSVGAPAHAGSSDIGAGLVGFGIGAILGSMMGPPEVYFVPPPPNYYGPVVYGPPDYDGPVAYGPMPRRPAPYDARGYPRYRTPPHAATHDRRPQPPGARTARSGAPTGAIEPVARSKTATAGASSPMPAPKSDAKFKAAQAKAKRDGVHTLTQKDIEGLSTTQLKQIRGY
jgi:hypothetical protein